MSVAMPGIIQSCHLIFSFGTFSCALAAQMLTRLPTTKCVMEVRLTRIIWETSLGLVRGMVFSTGRTAPNRLGSQLQSTVRPFTISLVVMSGLVTWYARSLMPTKPSFV